MSAENRKKGFTLAELLIVVAIIGVLVAISVPIFTSQLKKSRIATNQANARSAISAAVAQYLDDLSSGAVSDDPDPDNYQHNQMTYYISGGKIIAYGLGTKGTPNQADNLFSGGTLKSKKLDENNKFSKLSGNTYYQITSGQTSSMDISSWSRKDSGEYEFMGMEVYKVWYVMIHPDATTGDAAVREFGVISDDVTFNDFAPD